MRIRDINNINKKEYIKYLSKYQYAFLIKYVNESKINKEYIKRVSKIRLIDLYDGFNMLRLKKDSTILSNLVAFNKFNKIKMINAIGAETFIKNNKFFILFHMVEHFLELPPYIKHLIEKNKDIFLSLFSDVIVEYMDCDESIYEIAYMIHEFYDYNVVRYDKKTRWIDFRKLEFINKSEQKELKEIPDDCVELIKLDNDLMESLGGWEQDITTTINNFPIYKLYKKIGGNENTIYRNIYHKVLEGIIYFHSPENDNDWVSWTSPIFFYIKNDKYKNEEMLYDQIIYKNDET